MQWPEATGQFQPVRRISLLSVCIAVRHLKLHDGHDVRVLLARRLMNRGASASNIANGSIEMRRRARSALRGSLVVADG